MFLNRLNAAKSMLIYGEEAEDKAMVKMPRYRADNRNDHHQRHFIGDL